MCIDLYDTNDSYKCNWFDMKEEEDTDMKIPCYQCANDVNGKCIQNAKGFRTRFAKNCPDFIDQDVAVVRVPTTGLLPLKQIDKPTKPKVKFVSNKIISLFMYED